MNKIVYVDRKELLSIVKELLDYIFDDGQDVQSLDDIISDLEKIKIQKTSNGIEFDVNILNEIITIIKNIRNINHEDYANHSLLLAPTYWIIDIAEIELVVR